MASLEDLIRAAAKRGELTHLSLIFSGGEFRATFSPASRFGYVHAENADPVAALAGALKASRKVEKREDDTDFG